MKHATKQILARSGLFNRLDLWRRQPELRRWLAGGCCGPAPPPIKRRILLSYLRRYGLQRFVETGTHLGDTLATIAADPRIVCSSIELEPRLHAAAVQRFGSYANVTVLEGDSGVRLPEVVACLDAPALFWLDGHYSAAETAQAERDTPISAELDAILASPIPGHVILIDDAHCFVGRNDYPHLDTLLAAMRRLDRFAIEVSADIIRLTPLRS
ncbi:MAG: hypothetical protein VKK62_10390 [Synechococcaceae cyanobacterium]|nr:hypothetical protein [Synechococcaceae cyanobacterium]